MQLPALLLAVTAAAASCRSSHAAAFASIEDYHPKTDVGFLSDLALDLREMDLLLKTGDDEGFRLAKDIYTHGGYAAPHANLLIAEDLPYALDAGDELIGTGIDGGKVTVTVEKGSHEKGERGTTLRVLHSGNDCHRSGLPNTDTSRCLMEKGALEMVGKEGEVAYTYSTTNDIKSDHTIRNMSVNAKSKYRPHGNNHEGYYHDFQKYVDYFEHPDFANRLIESAFDKVFYSLESRGIQWDFTSLSQRARRTMIIHAAAYMILAPFVIRELETAVDHCDRSCPAENCNHDSFHAMDGAVALYTGTLHRDTGKGNLMFGLAQNMCPEFRTCGSGAASTSGTAKVNIDVFTVFKEMQNNLVNGRCLEAKLNKDTVAHEMMVPLIQASLLSLHMEQESDTDEARAERAVFTTAVLPLVYHCDREIVDYVAKHVDPTREADANTFAIIKEHYEEHYRCMVIGCLDVGGIWDPAANNYVEGAETCYVPPDESPIEGINFEHVLFIACVVIGVLGLIAFVMRRRRLAKFRRQQAQDALDYDSEDEENFADDDSLSS